MGLSARPSGPGPGQPWPQFMRRIRVSHPLATFCIETAALCNLCRCLYCAGTDASDTSRLSDGGRDATTRPASPPLPSLADPGEPPADAAPSSPSSGSSAGSSSEESAPASPSRSNPGKSGRAAEVAWPRNRASNASRSLLRRHSAAVSRGNQPQLFGFLISLLLPPLHLRGGACAHMVRAARAFRPPPFRSPAPDAAPVRDHPRSLTAVYTKHGRSRQPATSAKSRE